MAEEKPIIVHCFVCKKDVNINDFHEYYSICKKCMNKSQGETRS